jgi:hypothetical protein
VLSVQAENRTIDGKQKMELLMVTVTLSYMRTQMFNKKIVDSLRPIQINGSDKDSDISSESKV